MESLRLHMFKIASGLMLATTALHAFAGTLDVMGPILNSDADRVAVATSYVVWHMITLVLLLLAVVLWRMSSHRSKGTRALMLICLLGFAAIFAAANMMFFSSLFVMPQWTIFVVIAALVLWGRVQ